MRKVFKVVTDFNEINAEQIREYAALMASTYPGDLQQSGEFGDEMIQFIEFAKSRGMPNTVLLGHVTAHGTPSVNLSQCRNCNSHVHINFSVLLFR